jgi:hypothetical protein
MYPDSSSPPHQFLQPIEISQKAYDQPIPYHSGFNYACLHVKTGTRTRGTEGAFIGALPRGAV